MSDLDELILVSQLTGIYFEFPGFRKEGLLAKLQKIRAALVVGLACASLWVMGLQGVESIMGLESSQAVMGLLTAVHVVFLYEKRTLLGDVIQSIKNLRYNFRVFTEEEFQRRMGPIRKVARVYQISMFIYTMFYTVIPRLFDLTIGALLGTPLWSHRLPAAIASIVNTEGQTRDAQYVFATLGAVVYVPLTANAYSGVMSCLVLFGFYYSNLVEGFSKRLEEFDADFDPAERTKFIKSVAAHNRELYMLSKKLKALFGVPFAVQNFLGTLVCVSLMYSVLPVYVSILFMVVILAGTAHAGQHIADQTSIMFDSLCSFPWYELRASDRKYFVSMIASASEPLGIDFYGMLPLNHETLTAMGNSVCSYLTFMMSMM